MSLSYKKLEGQQRIILNPPTFKCFMAGLAQDGTGVMQDRDGVIHLR